MEGAHGSGKLSRALDKVIVWDIDLIFWFMSTGNNNVLLNSGYAWPVRSWSLTTVVNIIAFLRSLGPLSPFSVLNTLADSLVGHESYILHSRR